MSVRCARLGCERAKLHASAAANRLSSLTLSALMYQAGTGCGEPIRCGLRWWPFAPLGVAAAARVGAPPSNRATTERPVPARTALPATRIFCAGAAGTSVADARTEDTARPLEPNDRSTDPSGLKRTSVNRPFSVPAITIRPLG